MLNLDGTWRAIRADRELTKTFAEPDFDDTNWPTLQVPSHWQNSTDFAGHDGPVLYRRSFDHDRIGWDRRAWLELDGIFYQGDVWLDGDYLGTTEGYFARHTFEITEQLLSDDSHVLGIEVACPPQLDRTAKRTITGVFGHWDAMDDSMNPGGIWRDVRIRETGKLQIARANVLCVSATTETARVRVDLAIDASDFPPEAGLATVRVMSASGEVLASTQRHLSVVGGVSDVRVELDVESPPLWWPATMGEQSLVAVETTLSVAGETSDSHSTRLGLRTITVTDWIFRVNGERVFIRGANHGPTNANLATTDPEIFRRDVQLALEANLNLLRVHAHVTRPEFYEAADELGLLIWQDFPLQWGYARGARRAAGAQARSLVNELGHHPSIAMWCAHNEPLAMDLTGATLTPKILGRLAVSMFLPSWNKSVLDRVVTHSIRSADPTRFVDIHSGILPGPASLGTDTHFYFGWYHGKATEMPVALRAVPRLARFISEFGAQAVPNSDDFCDPESWPHLDWDHLEKHHCLQRHLLESRVPSSEHATFESWRDATQRYQADLLQLQIEDLRRVKYQPTGGYCMFSFADPHAAISWSILDHDRVPKLGYSAVAAASRPIVALVDYRTGDVHVVNDTRQPISHATVTVNVDGVASTFEGAITVDSVGYVGNVRVNGAKEISTTLDIGQGEPIFHREVVG